MNKKLRSTILTVGLLGGGLISGGLAANAYDTTDPTADVPVEAPVETDVDTEVAPQGLTAQVESDTPDTPDATADERPEGERQGRRGGGCSNEAVAELFGMTPEELREAKDAGSSLAEIAASEGVAVDEVIQTIVDEKAERIAEKVADGDLTEAEAAERLAEAEARATDRVNGVDPD